jgi:hypothetical protein
MSGLPFEEIGDQGQTQHLALFRVKLGAGLVVMRATAAVTVPP